MNTVIKRGELYYADLSPVVGSEQGGIRPVLVLQNDIGNKYSPTVIAAATTSRLTKAKLPTHIELPGDQILPAQGQRGAARTNPHHRQNQTERKNRRTARGRDEGSEQRAAYQSRLFPLTTKCRHMPAFLLAKNPLTPPTGLFAAEKTIFTRLENT